jgi:hypothetical protein
VNQCKPTDANEQCKRRTSKRHQGNGLGAKYTKAASIIPALPLLNFI